MGLGNLIAERVDWIDGRHEPHWVICWVDCTRWLARYPVREYPDGLQAIQRFRSDLLTVIRAKHQ